MRGWRTGTPAPRHLEQSAVTPARCKEADRVLPTGSPTAVEPLRAVVSRGMVAARRLHCCVLVWQVWSLVGVLATPQQRHLDRWAVDSPRRLWGAVVRLLWLQGGAEVAVGLVKNKIQIFP